MKRMTVMMLVCFSFGFTQTSENWKIHDMSRPLPPVVDPGTESTQDKPGIPPSDAVVLFDGTDLSLWCSMNGEPARWPVKNGYMETRPGTGPIQTRLGFGDCQLHVEWAAPVPAVGTGQGRGNSGVFLMGKYEVQVLDSYENLTYADGQAAAVYAQYPPLVNACRKPGQWQSYDIVFHRPRFGAQGELLAPATMTVLHNGVLVQDNVELLGGTRWLNRLPYENHSDRLPISLQDHSNPVQYRNIWIRPLVETEHKELRQTVFYSESAFGKFTGDYRINPGPPLVILNRGDRLYVRMYPGQQDELYAVAENEFVSVKVDMKVVFSEEKDGKMTKVTFYQGGGETEAERVN
ncbi:DUF1080 domain-containing protein [candidate division KSB1 bacterium]|nr:DUF1080 domain-containing protein [candidate division KSB1 bacterium]